MANNLMDAFGHRRWKDVFRKNDPVPFSDRSLAWINHPEPAFVRYILDRAVLPFDVIPPDPVMYKKEATYAIAQLHRLWITTKVIAKYLTPESLIVDLGAFPFTQSIIIREYLHNYSRLIATMNLPLRADWQATLDERNIETMPLNLDRYVVSGDDTDQMPHVIALDDASVDTILLTHVIEHLYHPLTIFQEVARVLKPGGHFIVSTDNAFMLSTFLNLQGMNDFLYEPVAHTAAMSFHFWRGHNRFFSGPDLQAMLQAVGLKPVETAFYEVLYHAFADEYYQHPVKSIPRWRADILSQLPGHRNEVIVVGRKM